MTTIKRNVAERDIIDGIRENWQFLSIQLQSKFPQLTSEDLKLKKNKEDDLLNRIESRLNENRKGITSIIENIQYEDFLRRTEV